MTEVNNFDLQSAILLSSFLAERRQPIADSHVCEQVAHASTLHLVRGI
jgi:hypothetical protein